MIAPYRAPPKPRRIISIEIPEKCSISQAEWWLKGARAALKAYQNTETIERDDISIINDCSMGCENNHTRFEPILPYPFGENEILTYDRFLKGKIPVGFLTKKHYNEMLSDLAEKYRNEQNPERKNFLKYEKDWYGTFSINFNQPKEEFKW